MTHTWSAIQQQRLIQLEASAQELTMVFTSQSERDHTFQKLEKQYIKQGRQQLHYFRYEQQRPALCRLESQLVTTLTAAGFVQVVTPTIMSRALLAKMTITETHPLFNQVFWLDQERCLRPMLAPHLYYLLKDLLRLWEKPVAIFEVGSCFRKESQGSLHANEFTMLNLVEMGLPIEQRQQRLTELAAWIANTVGISDYSLVKEDSNVYGETIDIVAGPEKIEVGSAAMGPHPLDQAWRIVDTWVGIGFGLERLLMVKEKSHNLSKMGRSLAYLNGIPLNI